MKLFLIKTVSFTLFFLFFIYGLDFLIQEGVRGLTYRDIRKWNEVINGGIDAEIIIVGSSRALVHFDPSIIESKTGKSCYNLGVDGNKYEVQKKVLELYLKHNKPPKILYWSIDIGTFQPTNGVYGYEQFIPYWSEPKVKEILHFNKDMNMSYLNFPVVRYANNKKLIYRGLATYWQVNLPESVLVKGYRERDIKWDGRFDEFAKENLDGISESMNDTLFIDFQELSSRLQKEGVEVRWIITPYYQKALKLIVNSKDLFQVYNEGANRIGIKFQNYSLIPISYKIENFYNGSHLNKNGVYEFLNYSMEY